MRASRFAAEQIICAIKAVDTGRKVSDICRELGAIEAGRVQLATQVRR